MTWGQSGGGACGVCGPPIAPLSSGDVARAVTDELWEVGEACEERIVYLGSRNLRRSPTLAEYSASSLVSPYEDPTDTF